MTLRQKPLSPHIQIYKPQITSITSILHRITGVILYFILKYKPAIVNAVDIIDNIDSDTIKQISDLVDQISDSKIANNISDLNSTIKKVDDVVSQLNSSDVTNAINTIEDVADQLDQMMDGKNLGDTALGGAIERYACTNLIPESCEAKIWNGATIFNQKIPGITYNFDIRDQVDACKKYKYN